MYSCTFFLLLIFTFFYVFVLYTFLKRFLVERGDPATKYLESFILKKKRILYMHRCIKVHTDLFLEFPCHCIPFQFTLGHFLPFLTIQKIGTSFHCYTMGVVYLTNNTLICNNQYNILLDTLFSK